LAEPLDLFARLKKIQSVFRRYLWNHEVWLKIHRGLNTSVEPKEIAESLVEHASRLLPVPWWAVVVPDKFSSVKMVASLGPGTELQRGALPLGEWVMRHGHDAVSADLSKDKRIPEGPAVAALGVPMVSGCQTVGALVGLDRLPTGRSSQLGKPLLDGLGALVEPAAVALDHAVELKRLESLSVIDDLTRLYNSSFLSSALHRETRRTSRTGNPLSLLFIDLDNFNTVNDSHGHLDGSRVLVEAAQLIQRSARETDIVARFGGDEFVVVLPDTGSEGARAVAERVRGNFAKHRFLATAGFEIRLTVSIGVAVLPEAASTADELLRIADCAMYAVKAQGKNGILVAGKADGEGQLSSWRCSVDQSLTGQ
jgi:diguanylate cyclase (GGDEF)-like protein